MKEQKPSKQYLIALIAESEEMVREYMLVKSGQIVFTQEQKDKWNERKEFIHNEIKRVRALL